MQQTSPSLRDVIGHCKCKTSSEWFSLPVNHEANCAKYSELGLLWVNG